jgi:hypothetical protein
MKIERRILALFLLLLVLVIGVISCQNKDKSTPPSSSFSVEDCMIDMAGEIDEYTVGDLTKIYNAEIDHDKCEGVIRLRILNSNGGNLIEAIKAGEFIRQNRIMTVVKDSCASSCVIMYLGGVQRWGGGKIGLHRPYSTNMSMTETEAKANYERINKLIRQYLSRMNIPERLLDVMNSVPPEEIRWYDPNNSEDAKQLEELHISGDDPVYAERLDSLFAKSLGISKQELYLRGQKSYAVCGDRPLSSSHEDKHKWVECMNDVTHGRR